MKPINSNSKLLVISFYFPPYTMVAARRWAKHLKYMNNDGIDFYVLTRHFETKNAPWNRDIIGFENRISRLNYVPDFPFFQTTLPKSFLQKIVWKLSYLKWKYIERKENTYFGDDSIGSEKMFLEQAEELIEQKKITHLVLTVGPYNFSAILPVLKNKFPNLNITIDYRDYWHDSKESMNKNLFEKEMALQDEVLKSVDNITVVNEEMKEYFLKITNFKKRILVLPHCFDPEDLNIIKTKIGIKDNSKIKLVYGGVLYSEMENYIQLYIHFIELLSKSGKTSHTNFYIPYKAYEKEFAGLKGTIDLLNYLPSEEFFEILEENDFVVYFRPDWSPNAFSSKFFELVALRKPILYFGPKSDVSEFIQKNNLGLHFNSENFKVSMNMFIDILEDKKKINLDYDINQHTFTYNNHILYEFLNLKINAI